MERPQTLMKKILILLSNVLIMGFLCIRTAINIGYACNMLTDDMNDVSIIAGNTATEVREEL